MKMSFERISSRKKWMTGASALSVAMIIALSGCGYLEQITPSNNGKFGMSNKAAEQDDTGYSQTINAMNGAKGINNREFLSKEVQDSIIRLAKLHQSVSDMQNRMQIVSPSVDQLENMKQEINVLGKKFDQIQMALHQDNASQMAPVMDGDTSAMGWPQTNTQEEAKRPMQLMKANTTYKAANTPAAPAVANTYTKPRDSFASQIPQGATGLIDIRIGEHKGKTRIVLDMAKAVDIRYDLDNEENIMVVEMPGQTSGNVSSKTFPKSTLLKGYDVQKSGDNTLVIFMFKKPTSILESMQLKGRGQSAHRYVFDMDK